MLIKVLLVLAILAVVAIGLRAPSGARHVALRRLGVAAFAVLAVLSVIFPDAWNAAAALVGVGRGTDLLLYGLIVVFLLYMVTTYRRFRSLEQQITALARRIAIDEVVEPERQALAAPLASTPETVVSTADEQEPEPHDAR